MQTDCWYKNRLILTNYEFRSFLRSQNKKVLQFDKFIHVVSCESINSVNWELPSSHIYDEIPKLATALGWICIDNFLKGTSQWFLIN